MVWITRLYLFLKGERFSDQGYHDQLVLFYKEEGEWLFEQKNRSFQKYGTSSHTANKVQKWCKKNYKLFVLKEKWPANSSKLNLQDYSIWNNISNHVYYHKVNITNDLCRESDEES